MIIFSIRKHLNLLLFAALTTTLCSCAFAQKPKEPGEAIPAKSEDVAFRPEAKPFSEDLMKQLKLPEGFQIQPFATGLGHARMLAIAPDGTVYLTCPKDNRILMLKDADGDGKAEETKPAIENIEMVHGIVFHEGKVYFAAPKKVWIADVQKDGTFANPKEIISDLPDGAQHPNRTLAIGPDNMLYISVGSSCNACPETNPENAAILRAKLDGTERKVFAKGLRNTIGYFWHPQTKEFWGMDHGSDSRGNDLPPEELNRIIEGKDYGWPYVFADRQIDPKMSAPEKPKPMSKEEYAKGTEPAILQYQAHSAPIGMVYYAADQFPEKYRNGAFVCMRGSWNREPASGYKIVFLRFENNQPKAFEDFVTGFLIDAGKSQFARVAGIAVAKDGSLLFTDDKNGVVYRVTASKK